MEKAKKMTIKQLARAFMDYRLESLAVLKTLDRAGVPVRKIGMVHFAPT